MARQSPDINSYDYKRIVNSFTERFKYTAYLDEGEITTSSEVDYVPPARSRRRSSFEPPWTGSVGQKNDVFYVESGGSDVSSFGPPPGGTNNNYKIQNGGHQSSHDIEYSEGNYYHQNVHPHQNQQDRSQPTYQSHQTNQRPQNLPSTFKNEPTERTKKGLKDKVKQIISPRTSKSSQFLESESHNGRHSETSSTSSGSQKSSSLKSYQSSHQIHPQTPQHTVTFNDKPSGLIKEVRLLVDPHRYNYGRRATLCESLFGIVPGRFGPKVPNGSNGSVPDRRIMVQGLLPGGEAYRCGQIKIGDWLMCINDLEVQHDNFDSILLAITSTKEIKLTLQKLAVQPISSPRPGVVRKSPVINEALVKLVSGDRFNLPKPSLADSPHCILFLTLTSSEDGQPKEDVLYQYPEEDSKLVEIRGMFLTIAHFMSDITGDSPRSSTMKIEAKSVHVGYAREGAQVLVIAMPSDRITLAQVNNIMEDVVRLLRVLYGSLKSAFSSRENHGRLNHFFTLLCQRSLLSGEMVNEGIRTRDQEEPFIDTLPGVRALTLPEETKVTINNILGDFEAADFADMSEEYYDLRRAYSILGSSLFYKGYLLASHLPKEDLEDAALFLQYHSLLSLCQEEQMGQVVVWKEVFPWRRCHVISDPLVPGYTEPEARWFLLVVGMKNAMLAVLLEAGGCAEWVEGHPLPDPFYVDQAKACLLQFEVLDLTTQSEIRLSSLPIPSLANIEWFLPSNKHKEENTTILAPLVKQLQQGSPKIGSTPKKTQPESILKKRGIPSPSPLQARAGAVYEVESDNESHSTGNSDGSTPVLHRRSRKHSTAGSDESGGSGGSSGLFRGQKKMRSLLSAFDMTGLRSSVRETVEGGQQGSLVKLTSGCDNSLFHYVQLEGASGIILCPTQQELASVSTPTHSPLLANFQQACLTIRAVFNDCNRKQQLLAAGMAGTLGSGSRLGKVMEHGILFKSLPPQTDPNATESKKQPPSTHYWVVGRQLPAPYEREFYVCFHDSAQQNLIEMAFKLGFGTLT